MLFSRLNLITFTKLHYSTNVAIASLGKSKKKLGKLGQVVEKKVLPVETDPVKLTTHVCGSNINKDGEDVKLGPDSEYPDWLWTLNTGPPKKLEDMDPETKEYWFKVRKMAIVQHHKMKKLKKF